MTFQLSDGFNSRDCLFLDFMQLLQSSLILHLLLIHVITRFFLSPCVDILSNLNYFPVPWVGNLTKKLLKKFKCPTFARTPLPTPLHLNIDTCISKRFQMVLCAGRYSCQGREMSPVAMAGKFAMIAKRGKHATGDKLRKTCNQQCQAGENM